MSSGPAFTVTACIDICLRSGISTSPGIARANSSAVAVGDKVPWGRTGTELTVGLLDRFALALS
jgi:hypothetical protein